MADTMQIRVEDTDNLSAAKSLGGVIIGTSALLTSVGMPASASIVDRLTNNHPRWVEIDDDQYHGVEILPSNTYNYTGMMVYPKAYLAHTEARTTRSTYDVNAIISFLNRSPSKSNELATLIQSYSSLHIGWDGGEAEPISQSTINEGLSFIELFFSFSKTKPHVSPAGDGELSFAWKNEGDYLEASFFGDGTLYWYSDINGEKETDTFKFSRKSIPRPLMDKILNFNEQ